MSLPKTGIHSIYLFVAEEEEEWRTSQKWAAQRQFQARHENKCVLWMAQRECKKVFDTLSFYRFSVSEMNSLFPYFQTASLQDTAAYTVRS